jgi:hypothetical protein
MSAAMAICGCTECNTTKANDTGGCMSQFLKDRVKMHFMLINWTLKIIKNLGCTET